MTHHRKDHPMHASVQAVLLQDCSVCLFLHIHMTKDVITNTEAGGKANSPTTSNLSIGKNN